MSKPKDCDDFTYKLMTKCWKYQVSSRPNFQEIIKSLLVHTTSDDQIFFEKFQQDSFYCNQLSSPQNILFNYTLNFKFDT